MTPTTYGRDFAYCLKSHGGVRGFNASLWRFLLRCTLFCHSVATFLTSVSSYEGGCGFEVHYELLSYFIKVFLANSNQTSQMLLTTHDINLLNEEFIRRDTIWFTDKDEQGETNVVRLSALGLHKNLSPYNAYKQGKLVKLPFLGS